MSMKESKYAVSVYYNDKVVYSVDAYLDLDRPLNFDFDDENKEINDETNNTFIKISPSDMISLNSREGVYMYKVDEYIVKLEKHKKITLTSLDFWITDESTKEKV